MRFWRECLREIYELDDSDRGFEDEDDDSDGEREEEEFLKTVCSSGER